MLSSEQIAVAADLLIAAHQQHSRIPSLPADLTPTNFDDAYAIQERVWAALGQEGVQRIGNWKCGCQTPESERFVAPIYTDRVFDNGEPVPTALLHEIAAESEIAYRIGTDLPKRDTAYSDDEIRAAIDAIVVTIEICDSRIEGWRDAPFYWQCADNQNSGAMVVGEAFANWQSIDMAAQEAQLWVDGEMKLSAVGGNTVVDPFKVVPSAVNQVINRTGAVKAGDLFTAGSCLGTLVVEPGSDVIARFPGIGEARAVLGV